MSAPKDLYLSDDKRASWLRQLVECEPFQEAVCFAKAEMMSAQPSSEQALGVNRFLDILNTLGKKEEARKTETMPRLTPPELLVPKKPTDQPKK